MDIKMLNKSKRLKLAGVELEDSDALTQNPKSVSALARANAVLLCM